MATIVPQVARLRSNLYPISPRLNQMGRVIVFFTALVPVRHKNSKLLLTKVSAL
jgi:hypothetical protein